MRILRALINWFRPRPIIQTRASRRSQRDADATYHEVHERLARDLGLPSPFPGFTPKRAK